MKSNKGFSLVELIIVIAIMAILAGALAPALIKYINKSRKSTDLSNASTLQTCVQTALSDEDAMNSFMTTYSTGSSGQESISDLCGGSGGDEFGEELSSQIGSTKLTSKYFAKGDEFYADIDAVNNIVTIYANDIDILAQN